VLPLTADAPIEVLEPEQMVLELPALAVGKGLTFTFTESDLLQPVAVMVSVR
jgi:hypothetical protein